MSKRASSRTRSKKPGRTPARAPARRASARGPAGPSGPSGPRPEETATTDIAYPMFPTLERGAVASVGVYRKTRRTDGRRGSDWSAIEFPWDPRVITWEQIRDVCGDGSYAVMAKSPDGKTVASLQDAIGDPEAADTARVPAIVADPTAPIHETPNGWIAFPTIESGMQAALVAYQQVAFYARDDAQKAHAALAVLLEKLTDQINRPDPGLAVLEQLVETQRHTLERLYAELRNARDEITTLKVQNVATGKESERAKAALYQKGVDVIDGVAGTIAKKLLDAGEPAGAASGQS